MILTAEDMIVIEDVLMDKARNPERVPCDQRQRTEAKADQAAELIHATRGHDPDPWISLEQRPEPIHNVALPGGVEFIEPVDEDQGLSILKCLLNKPR